MTSTSLPDSLIATLPGSSYTDPGTFAQEQERIFEAMWFCAVRSSDLAEPGAFRTVEVGRESILITRARDNSIRAFFNVCRHRGAKLRTEEAGEVKRAFQCPYHAWTYDLTGKLVAAPNLTKMPDVSRTEYGLAGVATHEWLGYVWVCLAEDPPPSGRSCGTSSHASATPSRSSTTTWRTSRSASGSSMTSRRTGS